MLKLNINYDMIDKIYQSKGEHRLRLIYKEYAGAAIMPVCFAVFDTIDAIRGIDISLNITLTILQLSLFFGFIPAGYISFEKLQSRLGVKTDREKAMDKIKDLSHQFNLQNLSTTPELLLQSEVYHKKYKLAMDGKPGIIRERYINVPAYNYKGDETLKSIKEEHRIGSKEYILTLDSPKKQKVLKRVPSMA